MRFLIISDFFSLEHWLIDRHEPHIMPAVYEWFRFLGSEKSHSFYAIMVHPEINKTIRFPNGSKIRIYRLPVQPYYLRKFISLFVLYGIGMRLTSKDKFDVVYGLSVYGTIAGIIGRKKGIFSVSRIFGSLVYYLMQNGQFFKLYSRYILQWLEIKVPSHLTICTQDGTQFKKAQEKINPGSQVFMLHNGIDNNLRLQLKRIPPVAQLNPVRGGKMLSIGRLTAWKRHDLSIQLFYLMKTKYRWTAWKLSILGKGEMRANLKKLVKKLGLAEQVEFLEPVPHSQIPELLSQHEIFLSMYDASNLSNSMWEAALAGRLICTRPVGDTERLFSNLENCLMADGIEAIAEQLHRIGENNILNMTRSARSMVDELLPGWEPRFRNELDIISKESGIK